MKYIIIGLGNYGHVLAEELSALGHEIIGADISESRVDSIKDKVATAFVIDATDEQSLSYPVSPLKTRQRQDKNEIRTTYLVFITFMHPKSPPRFYLYPYIIKT